MTTHAGGDANGGGGNTCGVTRQLRAVAVRNFVAQAVWGSQESRRILPPMLGLEDHRAVCMAEVQAMERDRRGSP